MRPEADWKTANERGVMASTIGGDDGHGNLARCPANLRLEGGFYDEPQPTPAERV